MPGGKKKGFFGRLRQVPEIRTEEAEGSEDANDGETCRSPTGLEIPEIRADDAGAAIDDLSGGCGGSSPVSPGLGAAAVGVAQGAAVSPATASVFDYESGGSTTSPDSTTVIGRERIVSLDIAGVGPQSPSPSVDRLSVSFSPDLGGDYSMDNMADLSADSKVRFSKDHLSALNPGK